MGMGVDWVARVPMDGYHLADCDLSRLGRLERKGAPDTFDVAGYVALLERLAHDGDEVVYAPAFERDIEQPVAGTIPVPPNARCVITEGNDLLLDEGGWTRVRDSLTEVWYLDLDEAERQRRLIARHERFGKSGSEARAWAHGSDQRNADVVSRTDERADLRLAGDVLGLPRTEQVGAP
jgi:pantothenate kinase